jgi:Butirosin biosynthesis protein H, N-terminal/Domain of unknown function (DUF4872)
MKYTIKGFKHLPGKNCVTTALRNILNHYHILLTEDLVLGLSGGLGCYYKEMEQFPNPYIGGNSSGMIARFCQNMGLKMFELRKDDPESAHKSLHGKILSDIPVIIQIDLYYLDYFQSEYNFSGHRVIPTGIDDTHVYVADTSFRSIKKTSIENFKKGRMSGDYPVNPNNLQVFIDHPESDLPIMANLWPIINRNAFAMVNSHNGNGLAALERFVDNVNKFIDLEYFQIQIDKAGTGGALGRRMYRDFLSEAILYRPHKILVEAYEMYSEVVESYKVITDILTRGETSGIDLLLSDILLIEKKAAKHLTQLPDE